MAKSFLLDKILRKGICTICKERNTSFRDPESNQQNTNRSSISVRSTSGISIRKMKQERHLQSLSSVILFLQSTMMDFSTLCNNNPCRHLGMYIFDGKTYRCKYLVH